MSEILIQKILTVNHWMLKKLHQGTAACKLTLKITYNLADTLLKLMESKTVTIINFACTSVVWIHKVEKVGAGVWKSRYL